MKFRTYTQKLRHLSPQAALVLRIGLQLCCGLLFYALLLLLRGQPYSLQTLPFFLQAEQIMPVVFTVYFSTGFLACFIEEQTLKQL